MAQDTLRCIYRLVHSSPLTLADDKFKIVCVCVCARVRAWVCVCVLDEKFPYEMTDEILF